MEDRTKHYFQKYIVRKLTGKNLYLKIKFFKLLFFSALGKKYEITSLLNEIIRDGDVFFDVGANLGQYISRILRKFNSRIQYYAFEPVKANYSVMTRHFKRYSSLVIENIALSDSTGDDTLYIPLLDSIEVDTQASLNLENRKKYYSNFVEQKIKKMSLDDYVNTNSIQKIDYLKIDTEGNDEKVLKGSLNSLKQFRPVIFSEDVEKSFYEKYIISNGYSLYFLTKDDKLIPELKKSYDTLNDIIIFIPKEKISLFSNYIINFN